MGYFVSGMAQAVSLKWGLQWHLIWSGHGDGRDGKGRTASVVTCTRKVCFLTNNAFMPFRHSLLCPLPNIKIEKKKEKKKKKSNHETKPKSKMNFGEMLLLNACLICVVSFLYVPRPWPDAAFVQLNCYLDTSIRAGAQHHPVIIWLMGHSVVLET